MDFDRLREKVRATLFSRATYSVAWSIYRMPHLFNKLQQAWAFYVATNMGFGCRIGSWGFDRYGKRVRAFWNKKMAFDENIFKRLSNVQLEHSDALKVLELYNVEDAFHYVDPPYIDSHQGHYPGYTEDDFKRLLEALTDIKGKFLLSSYPSKLLDSFIKKNGWHSISFEKPLSAQKVAKPGGRKKRKVEVLTANYPIKKNV